MDRRTFLALAGAALLTSACHEPSPTSAPLAREPATIGLTYIPNVQFSPFYLAEDNQEFSRRGLHVKLQHHGAQEGLFDALVQGREDFVLAGGTELMLARATGQDLVAIAGYYRSWPGEVIARSGAGIATLADLRGKRIGVPGRYGESWFSLLVALRNAGLTEADVQIMEIGYTAQAAMAASQVDAVIGFANNDAVQLKLAGISIVEIPLGPVVPLVSSCLITSRRTMADRPVVVRSVVAAMIAGTKAVVQSPADGVTATSSRLPGQDTSSIQAARATMDATITLLAAPDGTVAARLDIGAWEAMGEFMASAGLVPVRVPAEDAMTNDFVSP